MWKRISDELASQIRSGAILPGQRIANEADLADSWGVSRPTAHRAMSELHRAGLVVRQRRLGTVVAPVSSKETRLVALIFDHVAQAFDFPQAEMIQGIQEVLGQQYSLVWCDSMDDPQREADFLSRMANETDGIICFPIGAPENTPIMQSLVRRKFPLVLLDRVPEGFEGSAVISEDRETTRFAIQTLGQRGHRNIGFLGFFKPTVSSARARYDGFLDGMRDLGIEDPSLSCRWFVKQLEHEGDLFAQAISDCLFKLIHSCPPVTAFYCIQDSFAAEIVKASEQMGILIPDDLEIVVVNEWPIHLLPKAQSLHRIVRRKREIGVIAARRLLDLQAGLDPDLGVVRVPAVLKVSGFETAARVDLSTMKKPMEVT